MRPRLALHRCSKNFPKGITMALEEGRTHLQVSSQHSFPSEAS